MKKYIYFFLILFSQIIVNKVFSQASIITERPEIGSTNTEEAQIEKIELTDKYTVIYMSFQLGRKSSKNDRSEKSSQLLNELLEMLMNRNLGNNQRMPLAYISIKPSSKLIALKGDRTFKFIKASGIPEEPAQLDTYPGEKVNFKIYYEKIEPGITVFDFFEGQNSDEMRCWNFYNVHINNPSEKNLNKPIKASDLPIEQVFIIKGKVADAKTHKPLTAKLEYLLSPAMEAIDSTMTFSSGNYKTTLPKKGVYNCIISAPGYLVKQESIDLLEADAGHSISKDFYLTPIAKGDVVLLSNVYFETSEYDLLSASYSELNKLVTLLNENPTLTILLEGHTDIVGDKQANIELSQKRVNSVKTYLINKGISPKRIETKGWGSSKPLNSNGTDEERKVNRRVEFRVLNL
ncbi:MAG: OmpA family protein [Bacteroidota bacterium]